MRVKSSHTTIALSLKLEELCCRLLPVLGDNGVRFKRKKETGKTICLIKIKELAVDFNVMKADRLSVELSIRVGDIMHTSY